MLLACLLPLYRGLTSWSVTGDGHRVASSRVSGTGAPVRSAVLRRERRPAYPYSVIRGGAYSSLELDHALERDPVVAVHYAGFDRARVHATRADGGERLYASYRVRDNIYWTRKPVRLIAGESLLTDGGNLARARCGNRLSLTPQNPIGPDVDLDTPEDQDPAAGPPDVGLPFADPLLVHDLFPGMLEEPRSPIAYGVPDALGGVASLGSAPVSDSPGAPAIGIGLLGGGVRFGGQGPVPIAPGWPLVPGTPPLPMFGVPALPPASVGLVMGRNGDVLLTMSGVAAGSPAPVIGFAPPVIPGIGWGPGAGPVSTGGAPGTIAGGTTGSPSGSTTGSPSGSTPGSPSGGTPASIPSGPGTGGTPGGFPPTPFSTPPIDVSTQLLIDNSTPEPATGALVAGGVLLAAIAWRRMR